ncbi:hypothetical protein IGK61_003608 [Enterococcus sp. AZ063]|uniref:hypothetical protein n=1 Tax=Enterococcus sp. AZ064 TaxID=2774842 RepID=UPI003F242808
MHKNIKKRHIFSIVSVILGISLLFLGWEMLSFSNSGYYWKCLETNHVSHKHFFSDSVVTKANAHATKYGHKVTILE